MPTVIDALVVTLGLNPKDYISGTKSAHGATVKFTAASKEAFEDLAKEAEKDLKAVANEQKKTAEEAGKQAKNMARAHDSASESLNRVARNALRLFAVFTAGKAIKDFVADITSADSALGRLSQRIGQAPGDISAVATAVQRTGGSFDAAAGSFQRFSDSIQELKLTGNTGILPYIFRVQAAGGKFINLNKDILQTQVDIADNLKVINDRQGAATANYLGKQLGFDEGTVALMVQGGKAYRDFVEESKRLGIATKADTDAAQAFQRSMRTLMQMSEGLGRSIMTALTPTIVDLIKPLQEWIEANREWIRTEITARVREFADFLRTIDWKGVATGIRDFVVGCNSAAQAVGGWKNVIEGLFALWLGSKFLAVLRAIGLLRLALTGGKLSGGLIGALGVLGTAGIAAIVGTSIATDKGVANADKPGVATRSDDENSGAAVGPSGGYADPRLNQDRAGFRRWWGRTMPTWLGGNREPSDGIHRRGRRAAAASDEGRLNARQPEGPGRYRPGYKLGDADLDQSVVNTIAGEAIANNPESVDAVVNNMLNRVGSRGWGPSGNLREVARAPGQYAGYRRAGPSESEFIRSRIRAIASGGLPDNTSGSNSYRAESYYRGEGRDKTWARTLGINGKVVGGNRFTYDPSAANGPYAPYAEPKGTPKAMPAPASPSEPAVPKPSAWNGIPAAAAAVAQVQAAQAAQVSRTANDNRSSVVNDTDINGGIHIHTSADNAEGISREAESAFQRRSFAMAANYGPA